MTRRKLIPEMEGPVARWYARQRGSAPQRATYRRQAAALVAGLPAGAPVLEVAPGPGYLSVEIAQLGHPVSALDISRAFVAIVADNARAAGVTVDVRHGDVAAMPFASGSFDLVVCQAAFKNFTDPVRALDEMHRVLRPGGVAVIQDMNRGATTADIRAEVSGMRLGRLDSAMIRATLHGLRRRAYAPAAFETVAAASAFGRADTHANGITLEVRLAKPA